MNPIRFFQQVLYRGMNSKLEVGDLMFFWDNGNKSFGGTLISQLGVIPGNNSCGNQFLGCIYVPWSRNEVKGIMSHWRIQGK